jgi:xylulokinase
MRRKHILAIDLGSSSVKVAAVAEDGEIVAATASPVETLRIDGGGSEQDAEAIWRATVAAAREVLAGVDRDSVAGVTCDSQYFSVVPVDAEGRPLANLIFWLDSRGAPYANAILGGAGAFQTWLTTHGLFPLPSGNDSLSHALFIKHERPQLYERTAAFLEPADYLVARLTGVCASNPCTAFAQVLTDNRDLGAVRYDEDLLRMSGLDRDKLPALLECGDPVAPLRADVAGELGLAPSTPVFGGVNDTQALSVGTGVFRRGVVGINVGTTCQVLAFADSLRADLDTNLFCMPSPLPGRYALMAENGLGARLLDHFLGNVVFAGDGLADHRRADWYAGVETALAATPAGSNGLLYLPWLNGAQTPRADAAMRGGFLNLSLASTRTDMLRAIVEGITYSLRWQLPAAERLCGISVEELRFAPRQRSGEPLLARQRLQRDMCPSDALRVRDHRHDPRHAARRRRPAPACTPAA